MTATNEPAVEGTAAVLVNADTLPGFLGSGNLGPVLEQVAATGRCQRRRAGWRAGL